MYSTHATASSSALCASIGPGITSPIAYKPSILVANRSFTGMNPFLCSASGKSSRPRPSVFGMRPTATKTRSQVMRSPPSYSTTQRPFLTFAAVTFAPSRNSMPCFSKIFFASAAISASIPARIRSRNSRTVTFAPSRRQTAPSSRPI